MPSGFTKIPPVQETVDKGNSVNPQWVPWFTGSGSVSNILTSITSYGTTAQRPTAAVFVGQIYFDTTIGRPVWCVSTNPIVWVDIIAGGGAGSYASLVITGNNANSFLYSGAGGAVVTTPQPSLGQLLIGTAVGTAPGLGKILAASPNITVSYSGGNILIDSTSSHPNGPATSIQYNNFGSFGGSQNFLVNTIGQQLELGASGVPANPIKLHYELPSIGGFFILGRAGDSVSSIPDNIVIRAGGDSLLATTGSQLILNHGNLTLGGDFAIWAGVGVDTVTRGNGSILAKTLEIETQTSIDLTMGTRTLNLLSSGELQIQTVPGTNKQVLTSGGAGAPISWTSVVNSLTAGTNITLSSGTGDVTVNAVPSGSDTQIQYNNAGVFGAAPEFTLINGGVAGTYLLVGGYGSAATNFAGFDSIATTGEEVNASAVSGGPAGFAMGALASYWHVNALNVADTYSGAFEIRESDTQTVLTIEAYPSHAWLLGTSHDPGVAGYVITSQGPGSPVVWGPNPMFVSPLTTKGDLFGFDTADARVPVGTDGYVLTADSTDPLGVSYKPATGDQTPFHILTGETFIVNTNKQVLWAEPITIDVGGSLVINGSLIEVSPTGGSGSPAGPSTSIQWNNSGAFAGNAEFEFDNTGGTWNSIVLGDAGGAVLKVWNQATNNGVELTGRAADASIGNNPDPVYVIGGQETSTSNQGASLAANAGSLTSGGGFNLSGGSVASVTTGDGSSGGGVQFASGQGDVSGPVSFFVNPGHSQGGGIDFSAGVATNSDSMPEIGGTLTLNAGHASHAGNIDGDITLKTGDASVVPASGGLISFTTKGGSHTPLQFNRDGEWQVGDSHDSGTVNQVLISQGTGSSPIWAAPAPTYTLATLPTAVAGFMITVTDANGGAGALCYSLGATWLDAGTHVTVV